MDTPIQLGVPIFQETFQGVPGSNAKSPRSIVGLRLFNWILIGVIVWVLLEATTVWSIDPTIRMALIATTCVALVALVASEWVCRGWQLSAVPIVATADGVRMPSLWFERFVHRDVPIEFSTIRRVSIARRSRDLKTGRDLLEIELHTDDGGRFRSALKDPEVIKALMGVIHERSGGAEFLEII